MDLFEKSLNVKDYDCSRDGENYRKKSPCFNFYIQVSSFCNGYCAFCEMRNGFKKDNGFDFIKFEEVVKTLASKNIVSRFALTGGEPLFFPDRINQIIEILRKYIDDPYITLNTNGYNEKLLKEYHENPSIKEIHLSRHHYEQEKHESIIGIETVPLSHLAGLHKLKVNTVLSVDTLNNVKDIKTFLDTLSYYKIPAARLIQIMPLNDYAMNSKIDINELYSYMMSHYLNDGVIMDHNYCSCLDFLYVSDKYPTPVHVLLRETKQPECCILKQLVYDGAFLKDGFGEKIIY